MESIDVLYISLDRFKVLIILIFFRRVSFFCFQLLRVFFRLFIFFLKFSLFVFLVLYEKCMLRVQMGFFGYLKLKGVCVLFFQYLSYIVFVLEVLIFSLDIDLNLLSSFKSCFMDFLFFMNMVVLLVYCVIFIFFVLMLIFLID